MKFSNSANCGMSQDFLSSKAPLHKKIYKHSETHLLNELTNVFLKILISFGYVSTFIATLEMVSHKIDCKPSYLFLGISVQVSM